MRGSPAQTWPEFMSFGIYEFYRLFQPGFRKRRADLFLELMRPKERTRILDVGGYVFDWHQRVPIDSPITFLNLSYPKPEGGSPDRYTCLIGDGRKMDFPDGSFDIVYSNSVIEHVGSLADQQRFANEVRRVGKRYFIQTPNRWFFIEPHFVTVFVHFLPWWFARKIIRFCSFRGLFRSGDSVDVRQLASELRPLSLGEMAALFPDAEIHREKWFGLTKSLIAVRK
jgi:ubiquinone/menaquinone biosynthesis C-methylase UbiE